MEILKAFTLGIIEGMTEFLPISSTGHLIIANTWIAFSEPFTFIFDIFIQGGAILAVIIYFHRELFHFKEKTRTLYSLMIIGSLPSFIAGYFLQGIITKYLFHPNVVSVSLILGGIMLILIEKIPHKNTIKSIESFSWQQSLIIGCVQALAVIPGTSRSAVTIIGSLFLGASREVAATFSFFLAIPTLLGASLYSIFQYTPSINSQSFIILATGFMTATLSALLVIKLFLSYIQKHSFIPFGWYRIILGALILLFIS